MEGNDAEARTLYCGNIDEQMDEELLYELFVQAGPLEKISMPRDRFRGGPGYAFITFKHECSVPYAVELFDDTTLFGRTPKLRSRRPLNHNRSQSAPLNYGFSDAGPSAQMDFDSLLRMSKSMQNPALSGARSQQGTPTMRTGPPGGMGPPMGPPMMGMGPPLGTPMMGMGPPMGGPMMGMGPPMGMGPLMGGPIMGPPHARAPEERYQRRMEPCPPGEEDSGGQDFSDQRPGNDFGKNALSQSSLQGNWSARNASHMLPTDDYRRSSHNSRRDRYSDQHEQYPRSRGSPYDRDDGWRGNRNHRDRNRDRYHDRYDNRSRSDDKERRGRY